MSTLLHRLGRFAANYRWPVIVAWALIIALAGTLAATLSRPLTDEFDIPGSRFQVVLQTLQAEIPEAAGATGTVVLSAPDGFDEATEAELDGLITQWQEIDGVAQVANPFATEREIADAQAELEAGQAELEAAQQELEAGQDEIDAARAELEAAQTGIDAGRAELDAAQDELDAGWAELDAGEEQLEANRDSLPADVLAGAEAELEAGRTELEAGQAEIDAGVQELEAGQAEIDAGLEELEAGQVELDAGRTELEAGAAELELGSQLLELTSGVELISADRTVALVQVIFVDPANQVDPAVPQAVMASGDEWLTETGTAAGVEIDYSQEFSFDLSTLFGPAEVIGLAVAAIVLLIMLGRIVVAGLPLLMAVVGVGVGLGGAMALTAVVDMNSATPALALMLGLAVGIDYSLFIINRHRIQLESGMDVRDSIALATGTSGNAVAFAGMTVIIALSALTATGIPFLAIMGLVAAATVLVAVLVSITLTPALLSLLDRRVLPKRQRAKRRAERPNWAARVQRRPILVTAAILAVAGTAVIPTLDMRLGLPDGSSEPAESSAYRAYDAIRESFGAGANGPLLAVAELDAEPADESGVIEAQIAISNDLLEIGGVEFVVPFGVSAGNDTLAFQIVPTTGPADEETQELVDRLQEAAPAIGEAHGAEIGLTGQTVANIDISEQLADALPLYLALVVGLSLILLILVFRSILVPLLATAGFLVTLVMAAGTVVAVYQWGWLGSLFGVHEPGPILAFLPTLLVGVLFGLAMDYQLFLVSAMREAKVHGQNARDAIVNGFSLSARVVTAAAIIMVSVFGGFVFAHLTMIRPIGFGLAVGVLVDAFIVRMTLTPAVLTLLGDKAWWIPRWLDRILPDVDVEGSKLERELGLPSPLAVKLEEQAEETGEAARA